VSVTDELLQNAERYAADFDKGHLPIVPDRHVAIVTCMDARVNPFAIFGLHEGDAHIIRNAGGIVTDDVLRSLAVSQRLLGTEEIIIVHHVDCGIRKFDNSEFLDQIEEESGLRPPWGSDAFPTLADDVRQSVARVHASPFLPRKHSVRGFVYDEKTGRLLET